MDRCLERNLYFEYVGGGQATSLMGNGGKTPTIDNFGRLWPLLDVESSISISISTFSSACALRAIHL
jgi:hypothetical protein